MNNYVNDLNGGGVAKKVCAFIYYEKHCSDYGFGIFFVCGKIEWRKIQKKYSADNTKLEADGVR